ncbi:hypothetical protein BDY19DRAFT_87758 [Irpex rosettiformis]|uniref:Uncharacterized protein n=1 Tax=Irpex rosettiformis TaxID=378272 RepID=A0ACB8U6E9_9APHY|nr:hypothetical protein BDY19DRAFT_87758 [Irpex rosettiformis]
MPPRKGLSPSDKANRTNYYYTWVRVRAFDSSKLLTLSTPRFVWLPSTSTAIGIQHHLNHKLV